MRLLVLPGSLWLAYPLRDAASKAALESLIPNGFELAPVRLLATDDAKSEPKLLFNAYRLSSVPPFMRGHRIDVQTLVRSKQMDFDETRVMHPVLPFESLQVENNLWKDIRIDEPSDAFIHTASMSFKVLIPPLWEMLSSTPPQV